MTTAQIITLGIGIFGFITAVATSIFTALAVWYKGKQVINMELNNLKDKMDAKFKVHGERLGELKVLSQSNVTLDTCQSCQRNQGRANDDMKERHGQLLDWMKTLAAKQDTLVQNQNETNIAVGRLAISIETLVKQGIS